MNHSGAPSGAGNPPLATRPVTAPGSTPEDWLHVLHGIYGAGRNWASVTREIVTARPDWGGLLVDLREHGESRFLPGPHTLAAAAADLTDLGRTTGRPASAVLGHSFGGKVALLHARSRPEGLRQVWVIDSTPEPRPPGGSAWEMLEILRSAPGPFSARRSAIAELEARGAAPAVAQWISTNLEHSDGEYRWRLDLDAMESLLRDFFRVDLWDVVESPPSGMAVHLVKAEESSILSGEGLRRAERAVASSPSVFLHVVPGGHWLNADNPTGLAALIGEHLP